MSWQHITTAPRDGTWFWAACDTGLVRWVHFDDSRLPFSHDGMVWPTLPWWWQPGTQDQRPTFDAAAPPNVGQPADHNAPIPQ